VCDSPLPEAAFVDVRKGSKASVKVEFRVVGLELTEEELKAVGDAFDQQEAEEAAVNRAAMEEELKKAALKAVKEKMRSAAPVTMVEAEEEKKTKAAAAAATQQQPQKGNGASVVESLDDEDQYHGSCTFSGMEISAYLPAFMRPKAKCRPVSRKYLEHQSSKSSSAITPVAEGNGLNADLTTPKIDAGARRGIFHRTSQMKTDKRVFGRNWLAKKQELVMVNEDDGAIDIIEIDQLSKASQDSLSKTFHSARIGVSAK